MGKRRNLSASKLGGRSRQYGTGRARILLGTESHSTRPDAAKAEGRWRRNRQQRKEKKQIPRLRADRNHRPSARDDTLGRERSGVLSRDDTWEGESGRITQPFYSYRRASTGLRRAARDAG